MGKPVWFSKDDPPYVHDKENKLIKASLGNWRQWGGDPLVEPRYIFLWDVDNVRRIGEVPPFRLDGSIPPTLLPGEGHSIFDYSNLSVGTHQITFQVIVATHSIYVGAYDWWEFGDNGNEATYANKYVPYVETVTVIVMDNVPPPTHTEKPWMPSRREAENQTDISVAIMAKEGLSADTIRKQRVGMCSLIWDCNEVERKKYYNALAKEAGWPLWG